VQQASTSGNLLLNLVNDILDMSKIDSGQLDVADEAYEVRQVVKEAMQIVRPLAKIKGLPLRMHFEQSWAMHAEADAAGDGEQRINVPRMVVGDRNRLRQILLNLLTVCEPTATAPPHPVFPTLLPPLRPPLPSPSSILPPLTTNHDPTPRLRKNAIKFTAQGSVTLKVKMEGDADARAKLSQECGQLKPRPLREGKLWLTFEVHDTGVGIQESNLSQLFQIFGKLKQTEVANVSGCGLGLMISKQLSQLMGGGIFVKSVKGEGSSFCFLIQVGRARRGEAEEAGGYPGSGSGGCSADGRSECDDGGSYGSACGGDGSESRTPNGSVAETYGGEGYAETAASSEWGGGFGGGQSGLGSNKHQLAIRRCGNTRLLCAEDNSFNAEVLTAFLENTDMTIEVVENGKLCLETYTQNPDQYDGKPHALILPLASPPLASLPLATLNGAGGGRGPACNRNRHPRVGGLRASDRQPPAKRDEAVLRWGRGVAPTHATTNHGPAARGPRRPAVILMDCQMPVMDGFEATVQIRKWERGRGGQPGQARQVAVPIIALTAYAMSLDRRKSLQSGMDFFLTKPVSKFALMQTIADLTSRGSGGGSPQKPAMSEGRAARRELRLLPPSAAPRDAIVAQGQQAREAALRAQKRADAVGAALSASLCPPAALQPLRSTWSGTEQPAHHHHARFALQPLAGASHQLGSLGSLGSGGGGGKAAWGAAGGEAAGGGAGGGPPISLASLAAPPPAGSGEGLLADPALASLAVRSGAARDANTPTSSSDHSTSVSVLTYRDLPDNHVDERMGIVRFGGSQVGPRSSTRCVWCSSGVSADAARAAAPSRFARVVGVAWCGSVVLLFDSCSAPLLSSVSASPPPLCFNLQDAHFNVLRLFAEKFLPGARERIRLQHEAADYQVRERARKRASESVCELRALALDVRVAPLPSPVCFPAVPPGPLQVHPLAQGRQRLRRSEPRVPAQRGAAAHRAVGGQPGVLPGRGRDYRAALQRVGLRVRRFPGALRHHADQRQPPPGQAEEGRRRWRLWWGLWRWRWRWRWRWQRRWRRQAESLSQPGRGAPARRSHPLR
jgi:CheY-like chemotaxis protein